MTMGATEIMRLGTWDCLEVFFTICSSSLTDLELVIDHRVAILASFDGLGDDVVCLKDLIVVEVGVWGSKERKGIQSSYYVSSLKQVATLVSDQFWQ